jgi:rhodanese-related sulfurtransferase
MTTLSTAKTLSGSEFSELLITNPDVRVLDVRTGAEFESVHIPGSYNVPLDTLSEHATQLANTAADIVLVCQSGARATQAHTNLAAVGGGNLYVLDGGVNAWEAGGHDVKRGDKARWALDRQVRFTAGLLALIAVVASVFVPGAKWIAAGVAGGLVYSAATNTCAMGTVLAKLPYNKTDNCNIDAILAQLSPRGNQ